MGAAVAEALAARAASLPGQAVAILSMPCTLLAVMLVLVSSFALRLALERRRADGKASVAAVEQECAGSSEAAGRHRRKGAKNQKRQSAQPARKAAKSRSDSHFQQQVSEQNAEHDVEWGSDLARAVDEPDRNHAVELPCEDASQFGALAEILIEATRVDEPMMAGGDSREAAELVQEQDDEQKEHEATKLDDEDVRQEDDDEAWGCESSATYSAALLLAHRGLSLRIARGAPGLDRCSEGAEPMPNLPSAQPAPSARAAWRPRSHTDRRRVWS